MVFVLWNLKFWCNQKQIIGNAFICLFRFPPPKKPGEDDEDNQSVSTMPESVASKDVDVAPKLGRIGRKDSASDVNNTPAGQSDGSVMKLGRIGRKDSTQTVIPVEAKPLVDPQYAATVLEKFVLEIVMMVNRIYPFIYLLFIY